MRRTVVTLLVVLVVLTAGCSGDGGTDTETESPGMSPTAGPDVTTTRSGTTAGPESTGSPSGGATSTVSESSTPGGTKTAGSVSEGDLPPGVSTDGIENATMLQQAHFSHLRGTSFTTTVEGERKGATTTYTIENGSESIAFRISRGSKSVRYWFSDAITTRRNESTTPPKLFSYGSTSAATGARFTYAILLSAYPGSVLQSGTFEVDGVVTRGGERLVRLSATGVNTTADRGGLTSSTGNLTDMSGDVWVTPDGLVRRMSIERTYDTGGTTSTRSLEFRVSDVGSTAPSKPSWYDEAPKLEGSLTSGGAIFELSHTGGRAIPSGTTLTVQATVFGGSRPIGNVTIDAEVGPGDTVYLYRPASGSGVAASVGEPPAGSEVGQFSSGSLQVAGTVGEVRFVIGLPQSGGR